MRIKTVLFILLMLLANFCWSQNNSSRIPLLGERAPAFKAMSTKGLINFPEDFGSKWKIICSHPADFTPVCTSELMKLALMQQEFADLNVELAVISADALATHKSWVESMEAMNVQNDKPVKIYYPMIDDSKLEISRIYGMLAPGIDEGRTVRGVFIISPDNKIAAVFFYPKNVGRNMEEIKRTVIALQTADANAALTPANWKPGDDVLMPYPYPYTYYDPENAECDNFYHTSWYMLYKKIVK